MAHLQGWVEHGDHLRPLEPTKKAEICEAKLLKFLKLMEMARADKHLSTIISIAACAIDE
jgi:hypothetical protein